MKDIFFTDGMGALTDPEQIKLLLLYLFISVKRPMTLSEITDTVRRDELCNYFDMAGCLSALVKNSLMDKMVIEGTDYYSPTAKGFSALSQLERMIPKSVRDKADLSAAATVAEIIRKESVVTEITEIPLGYTARLQLNDETMKIFDLSVYMPTVRQAEALVKRFRANPEEVYLNIMNRITGRTDGEDEK